MKLIDAENLTNELMKKHNLIDYSFEWKKRLINWRVAGSVDYKKKEISLQPTYVEKNSIEEVKNTILHEIAHALMPKHGHNKFWKRKAIEIGCTGLRTYSKNVIK